MVTLQRLASFLQHRLPPKPGEPLLFHPKGDLPEANISRLILATEPSQHLTARLQQHKQDVSALFLHRPFKLEPESLPGHVAAVFTSHTVFDQLLTTGWNLALADRLGCFVSDSQQSNSSAAPGSQAASQLPRQLQYKHRAIGGVFTLRQPCSWPELFERVSREFDNTLEDHLRPSNADTGEVRKLALMNAFNPELIGQAHEHGADVYITGQVREAGWKAAEESGMGVIAVGHEGSEIWGLRHLAAKAAAELGLHTSVVTSGEF